MHAALVSATVELGDTSTRSPPEANRRVSWVDFPGADDKRLWLAKIESKAVLEEASGPGTRFGRMRPRNGCADSHRWAYSRRPKFADILGDLHILWSVEENRRGRGRGSGGQSLEWGSMKSSGVCLVCTEKSSRPHFFFGEGPATDNFCDNRLFSTFFYRSLSILQQQPHSNACPNCPPPASGSFCFPATGSSYGSVQCPEMPTEHDMR
jgi:hypothetical protein